MIETSTIESPETSTGPLTKKVRLMAFSLWEQKVKSINKRLAKRGAPVIQFACSEVYDVLEPRLHWTNPFFDSTDKVARPYVDVTINVQPVNVGGYRPVAVLDYNHSEPIIRSWPREELTVEAPESPFCDYCRKDRHRTSLVVLENVESPGTRFYVGRTCVKDFIGYDPASMIGSAELVAEAWLWNGPNFGDDDSEGWGGPGKRNHDVPSILIWAVAAIREFGWRGRDYENGSTTATIVHEAMYPTPPSRHDYIRPPKPTITAEDKAAATAALEYVKGIETPWGDYVRNLRTLARDGFCNDKEFNLTVSMARFVQNQADRDREYAERQRARETRNAGTPESQHVGNVKERLTFSSVLLESIKVIPAEGPYGPTSVDLLKFVTPEGNRVCWFSSSATDFSDLVGKDVKLVGTVKGHNEFQGVKETQLTRCRVELAS